MNAQPIRDARLRIELDTADAQARLDKLEEQMDDIRKDVEGGEEGAQERQRQASGGGKSDDALQRRGGQHMNRGGQTRPGRFGISRIPGVMSAEGLAGAVPYVGGTLRAAIGAELAYGAFAGGFTSSVLGVPTTSSKEKSWWEKLTGPGPFSGKKINKMDVLGGLGSIPGSSDFDMHKKLVDMDHRLKAFAVAFESIVQYGSAAALTGGHVDPMALKRFARSSYEWEFVQARKDKHARDLTLRVLGQEAPGVIKELFSVAVAGNIAP